MVRHFLDIHRLDSADLRDILDDAHARKKARKGWPKGRADADAPGKDRVLAMIFEKNSTRTRFSFDAAIRQLGTDHQIIKTITVHVTCIAHRKASSITRVGTKNRNPRSTQAGKVYRHRQRRSTENHIAVSSTRFAIT